MHGYVTFERVVVGAIGAWSATRASASGDRAGESAEDAAVVDEEVRSNQWSLGDTLADLKELWSQLTFFVLDPASWG